MSAIAELAHAAQSAETHHESSLPSIGEFSHRFADAAGHFSQSAFRGVSAASDGVDAAVSAFGVNEKSLNLGKLGKLKAGPIGMFVNGVHMANALNADHGKFGRNTADAVGGFVGSTLGGLAGKAGGMSAGTLIGGAIGGIVGSAAGPLGTVAGAEAGSSIGAVAGTVIGSFVGGRVGESLVDTLMTLKK